VPSAEIAAWSARVPSTSVRQWGVGLVGLVRSMATTSGNLDATRTNSARPLM
jgi:hypothetical protein